jgi:hypothetical protein
MSGILLVTARRLPLSKRLLVIVEIHLPLSFLELFKSLVSQMNTNQRMEKGKTSLSHFSNHQKVTMTARPARHQTLVFKNQKRI